MHLTTHTDYALRTLMVLGVCAPRKIKTSEIGEVFQISENHLVKVIQHLAQLGYVETLRGKEGGVRLAREPYEINIGQVVRLTESDLGVVPCLREGGQECFITPVCALKGVLNEATEAFLHHLDAITLADLLKGVGQGRTALERRLGQRMSLSLRSG
jgi:Rrf2 family transcriptional regulator, nitric oxide-sensitive transcriptional repressor